MTEQQNEVTQSASRSDGMRLSDDERQAAATQIGAAFAAGCLTPEDLEERLDKASRAKVRGDLTPLLWDLPPEPTDGQLAVGQPTVTGGGRAPRGISAALLGVRRHRGAWPVPRELVAAAVVGGVVLDLRDALFTEPVVTVRLYGLLGMLKVIVPPGVEVVSGDEKAVSAHEAEGNGPLVRIVGGGVLGFTLVEADASPPSRSRRRSVRMWMIRIR